MNKVMEIRQMVMARLGLDEARMTIEWEKVVAMYVLAYFTHMNEPERRV